MHINILIVESNASDVEQVKNCLDQVAFPYNIIHADSYTEGLVALREQTIHLVLLDLSLLGNPSLNTFRNFLQEAPEVPIIVMTGPKTEAIGLQSVKAGAQDYLIKGEFDGKQLTRIIKSAFKRFEQQTALKLQTEALPMKDNRMRDAQEIAKFATWDMDLVSNSMTWSKEMYKVFGYEPDSFAPALRDYKDYVHIEDRKIVSDFFEEAIKTGKPVKAEHRILIKNRIKYLLAQARVNYEERSNKIMLIGTVQDITEQKETDRNKAQNQQQSPTIKEEALSKLSFSVRTPLSSAMNLLYLLQQTKLSAQQRDFAEGLKTSFDDLYLVLNNLLNYVLLLTESASTHEEEIRMSTMLGSLQKVLLLKARQENIELNFKEETSLPKTIVCDVEKVTQAIHNAVILALRNTFPKSPIDVILNKKIYGKGRISLQVEVRYAGKELITEGFSQIIDSKENWQNLLFLNDENEEYDQLCLFILFKLTDLLGGKAEILNTQMRRSTIYLELPFSSSELPKAGIKNKPIAPINILLVEDHILNQIATRHVLTSWSEMVSVEVASNGMEGIEKWRGSRYDVVIMDIEMPVMNGIDAATEIRRQSDIPIIALTANASKQEEERCLHSGMNGYLSKPIKPEELQMQILRVLS
ncbi:MAG: response regulator [Saprospiraceae bacterium]|nr:response regulator [Saprospiraceae bacterium]